MPLVSAEAARKAADGRSALSAGCRPRWARRRRGSGASRRSEGAVREADQRQAIGDQLRPQHEHRRESRPQRPRRDEVRRQRRDRHAALRWRARASARAAKARSRSPHREAARLSHRYPRSREGRRQEDQAHRGLARHDVQRLPARPEGRVRSRARERRARVRRHHAGRGCGARSTCKRPDSISPHARASSG